MPGTPGSATVRDPHWHWGSSHRGSYHHQRCWFMMRCGINRRRQAWKDAAMSLKGKVALVTGSTSGIGLGIARALAAAGADIMLNGFGDAEQIAEMVAAASKSLGSLDILVNNAGVQFTANVEDFPNERWDQVIAINL